MGGSGPKSIDIPMSNEVEGRVYIPTPVHMQRSYKAQTLEILYMIMIIEVASLEEFQYRIL